jgi:hypothetical protein
MLGHIFRFDLRAIASLRATPAYRKRSATDISADQPELRLKRPLDPTVAMRTFVQIILLAKKV